FAVSSAAARFPAWSCLSRVLSLPSAELAFGEPAPNTAFTSDVRLLSVVHVPGTMSERRLSGATGRLGGPVKRRESSPHETRSTAPTSKPRAEPMRRRIRASPSGAVSGDDLPRAGHAGGRQSSPGRAEVQQSKRCYGAVTAC